MPPAKLYFVLVAVSSTTTSRYPVKWLLSRPVNACRLSHVARRRLWLWLRLWLRLWCNVHVVNVCCVSSTIFRVTSFNGRRGGNAGGKGRGTAAAFNVRSWQWNNIKLCLYICNAAAASTSSLPPTACAARAPWCMQLTSAAHSAQAPSPSLPLLSCFFFIKNSFFCVLFTLTFHLCLLMQLQIVWHTRTVKVLSGFARFDK